MGEEFPVLVRDLARVRGLRVRLVPLAILELLVIDRIDPVRRATASSSVAETMLVVELDIEPSCYRSHLALAYQNWKAPCQSVT